MVTPGEGEEFSLKGKFINPIFFFIVKKRVKLKVFLSKLIKVHFFFFCNILNEPTNTKLKWQIANFAVTPFALGFIRMVTFTTNLAAMGKVWGWSLLTVN